VKTRLAPFRLLPPLLRTSSFTVLLSMAAERKKEQL